MKIWEDMQTKKLVYLDDFIRRYNATHLVKYNERTMTYKLAEFIRKECKDKGIRFIGECY